MSRPVDVLAVLTACDDALWAANAGGPSSREIEEARAAVAELVEAARGLADEVRKMDRPWHLSGGAENYGFDHGKADAAKLVEKNLHAALAKFEVQP